MLNFMYPAGSSLLVPRWRGLGGGQECFNCVYYLFSPFTYHRLHSATIHLMASGRRVIVRRVDLPTYLLTPLPSRSKLPNCQLIFSQPSFLLSACYRCIRGIFEVEVCVIKIADVRLACRIQRYPPLSFAMHQQRVP